MPRGTAFGRRHLHQSAGRVSDLTKLSLFARQQAQLHFRSRPAARGWLGRDWIRKTAGFYRPAHQAGLVPSLASLGWPKLETARRRVGAREWRQRNTAAGVGSTAASFRQEDGGTGTYRLPLPPPSSCPSSSCRRVSPGLSLEPVSLGPFETENRPSKPRVQSLNFFGRRPGAAQPTRRRRSRRRAQNSQYLWRGFRRWARSTVSFHSAVPTVASSAGGCRQAAQALGR